MSDRVKKTLESRVYDLLRTVMDPELGVNVVDMGFVYDFKLKTRYNKPETIWIQMTLTMQGCPMGRWFVEQIREVVSNGLGIDGDKVVVEMVFDPPWTPEMMSEEAKAQLGFDEEIVV